MTRYRFPAHAFLPAVAALLLAACSGQPPVNLGLQANGELAPCPDSPNCVSSFAPTDDATHRIAPIRADADDWQRLPGVLKARPRTRIVTQREHYLRVEATTRLMRYVDDLEFLYRPDESRIHVRSASRLGYSDMGANRQRVEAIRKALHESGQAPTEK